MAAVPWFIGVGNVAVLLSEDLAAGTKRFLPVANPPVPFTLTIAEIATIGASALVFTGPPAGYRYTYGSFVYIVPESGPTLGPGFKPGALFTIAAFASVPALGPLPSVVIYSLDDAYNYVVVYPDNIMLAS